MIVREVLKHPELLANFDWFNDGTDTISWLKGEESLNALVLAWDMEKKLQLYHEKRIKEMLDKLS